jgi:hypothetical protein
MIDTFADLAATGGTTHAEATLKTQEYLDALWAAAGA